MDEHHLTDEQMIAFSKQNPKEFYYCDDGRIIYNGKIFKNEKELIGMLKLYAKFLKFKNFFKRKKQINSNTTH